MSDFMNTEILENLIIGYVPHRIYAFSTPQAKNHLKVGETSRSVPVRLEEWKRMIIDLKHERDWLAMLPKSAKEQKDFFQDFALHSYFENNGYYRLSPTYAPGGSKEFFPVTLDNIEEGIDAISSDYDADPPHLYTYLSIADNSRVERHWARTESYEMRDNQKEVVKNIITATEDNSVEKNYLLFAVMRFGKTFVALEAAKAIESKLTVVVCAKADVKGEWQRNLEEHKDFEGYVFLDDASRTREELTNGKNVVLFLTLQDFKGKDIKDKHKQLLEYTIDLMIVDESHFGARAQSYGQKIQLASDGEVDDEVKGLQNLERLHVKYKLHLSGTPYRILMGDEFKNPKQIVGKVCFEDILAEKDKWFTEHLNEPEWMNPYFGFPQMIRFGFNLSDEAKQRIRDLTAGGATVGLNELFGTLTNKIIVNQKTKKVTEEDKKDIEGKYRVFRHADFVLRTVKALDGSENSDTIFSILNYPKLKDGKMARHIVMVLPYKASCDAMEQLLISHEAEFINLNGYEVINIAGHDCRTKYNSIDRVKRAIMRFESEGKKTISLTVNRMLTGVTVPQWDTMIYMKGTQSPQEYDQAIYRLQSPYVTKQVDENGKVIHKEDLKPQTLLIDFAPNRMMSIEQYKAFILSASEGVAGNDRVKETLERQITVSPIITVTAGSLTEVKPADILKYIAAYSSEKGIIEEASQISVDISILDDAVIKAAIDSENEINSKKGIKFNNTEGGKGTASKDDVNADDEDGENESGGGKGTTAPDNNVKEEESEDKKNAKKIQNYYLRILFYAFLSKEMDINNLSDIIRTYDDNARLAHNLGIKKEVLEALLTQLKNPWVRSDLDNKISNANSLLADNSVDASEKVARAIRSFNRISESEVFTPKHIADLMADKVIKESSVTSPISVADLSSKSGIYLLAIFQKLIESGLDANIVSKGLFAVATSPVAYEFTRKVYELMEWNVENIAPPEIATSYDLTKKEESVDAVMAYFDRVSGGQVQMKFDVVVGNPPYQDDAVGGSTSNAPIYNLFMDRAYSIADKVMLITPARFLFNAGATPKSWNEKMLKNVHLKVILFEEDATRVFPTTSIPGGVAITYYDKTRKYPPIQLYTSNPSLDSIMDKVSSMDESVASIVSGRGVYRLTDKALHDLPDIINIQSKGHSKDVGTSAFKILDNMLYFEHKPIDDEEYIRVYGLKNSKRTFRWMKKSYLDYPESFDQYKVFISKANGAALKNGSIVGAPFVADINVGATETFLTIGGYENKVEAENLAKYIKCKFVRTLVSILKATPNNTRETWSKVPLQNFTPQSDIDWTQSIPDIDRQLYAKYGLDEKEIAFIEEKVKVME